MSNPLEQYRDSHRDFEQDSSAKLSNNPFEIFEAWFAEADQQGELEANAFVLGTTSKELQSSLRIVYLKELLDERFVFYTNYNSQKGKEIAENPKVSMLFFYPKMARQMRIEGTCTKVDAATSDDYFNSRPRGSQIGAWASHQSEVLSDMSEITDRVQELEKQYPNEVPRPEHWGGYQIEPTHFEFWLGKESRLHERIIFDKVGNDWKMYRKNP